MSAEIRMKRKEIMPGLHCPKCGAVLGKTELDLFGEDDARLRLDCKSCHSAVLEIDLAASGSYY